MIGPDVAIHLAHDEAVIRGEHQLLAPALLRSQLLSLLYQAVHRGEMTDKCRATAQLRAWAADPAARRARAAAKVARMLADYVEAGISEFVLMPASGDPLGQCERLAAVRERLATVA